MRVADVVGNGRRNDLQSFEESGHLPDGDGTMTGEQITDEEGIRDKRSGRSGGPGG
ncbi:MAG: hypothetical protein ACJAXA_003158 [Candidatus Aldehydirespiratoraceae bacterium]|jgi:hypothetical protein